MSQGVVGAGHPLVCDSVLEILRAGGNAFDGVVAAGFAAAVAEPALTSLGGGGFLLARSAAGEATLFDFFVDSPGRGLASTPEPHFLSVTVRFPGSEQVFNAGLGAIAVPGSLKGLLHVHARLGRMSLADVVAPAIALARDGVTMNEHQAYFLSLLHPIMTHTPAGRRIYAPSGATLATGSLLKNPELAAFLERIPDGSAEEFYRGEIARRVADDMSQGNGLLTSADLAEYRVIERRPLEFRYRDHRILTNPQPSFGGSLLGLALMLAGERDFESLAPGSADHLVHLISVMQEVDRLRELGVYGHEDLTPGERHSALASLRKASRGTTHVSVVDGEGNVASMTSSNGEGSGYLAPGTGIMLNNMMGEDDLHPEGFHAAAPGERVSSMMSPCVLLRGNETRLVLGSGGSKRIRTALFQALSYAVDFGLGVREIVEWPRLHWDGETVQVEPGFPDDSLAALRARWPVNLWPSRDVYFGGVNAVSVVGGGAGDPRRGGAGAEL